VGEVVDLEKFITYWATTSLMRFWDSYPGSANNFFCYHNPKSGKFEFIPWAPDSAFGAGWFEINPRPRSIYAEGYLAHRLYGIPEIRTRYRQRMNQLLADVWQEDELLAEVQRMAGLIRPHSDRPAQAWEKALEALRETIRTRRDEVTADMAGLPEQWPYPPQPELTWKKVGDASCRFSFSKAGGPSPAPAELSVKLNGREETFARVDVLVIPGGGRANTTIMILGHQHETGGIGILLPVNEGFFTGNKPVPLDGNHVTSWLVRFDTVSNAPTLKFNAYALNWGEVRFSKGEEGLLQGSLTCELLKIPIQ